MSTDLVHRQPSRTGSVVVDGAAKAPATDAASSRRHVRLGERDLAILAWLARQRFATASQIGERFSIGVNRTCRRLGQLGRAGYVERRRPFTSPSAYLASKTALAVVGSELPPARVDVRTYRHDLGVTDLVIEYELAGARIVTEREMRMHEALRTGTFAARFSPELYGASPRRHFPDLAVQLDDGSVQAFELELTPKRTGRLRAILKAYRRSPHIASIVYYVERRELGRRIEELARSLHLDDRLEVRWW
jgi:hypothetical protein